MESRSSDWTRARGEVVQKLAEMGKNANMVTKRYFRPSNKIEEGVEKPTYHKPRVGKGLLNRRRPKRVSDAEPKDMRRVRIR